MRKRQRLAFLAIGGLGLLAAIAPGLAATLTVPTGTGVPAAGQAAVEVQGFTVTAIDWTVDSATSEVDEVSFTITRSQAGAAAVNAVVAETSGDAIVRVRLEEDPVGGSPKDWVSCAVTAGAATCNTSASGATMVAGDLDKVNIIAFDRN